VRKGAILPIEGSRRVSYMNYKGLDWNEPYPAACTGESVPNSGMSGCTWAQGRATFDTSNARYETSRLANRLGDLIGKNTALTEQLRKHRVQAVVGGETLASNPYPYENQVVAVSLRFDEMLGRDVARFMEGILVTGVPSTEFTSRLPRFVIGRVIGKANHRMPSGQTALVTQMKFIDTALEGSIGVALRETQIKRVPIKLPTGVPPPAPRSTGKVTADENQSAGYRHCIKLGIAPESCATLHPPTQQAAGAAAEVNRSTQGASSEMISAAETHQETLPNGGLVIGTWKGSFWSTLLPFEGTIQISNVGYGQSAGRSEYSGNGLVVCRGVLRLLSAKNDEFLFEENITEKADACPIRGTLRLRAVNSDTAEAQWYRSGAEGKPSHKAKLQRR
jgi:hypothetical protein